MDYLVWITNLAIAVATGVLAVYAVLQTKATRDNAKAAENQARSSEAAAKAASDNAASAEANTKTLKNLERPWVLVRMEPIPLIIPGVDLLKLPKKEMTMTYTVRNYGHSPAWVTYHWCGIKVLPNPIGSPIPIAYIPAETTIRVDKSEFYEPGKSRKNDIFVPYSDIMKFSERSRFLYIYGFISYRDVWEGVHETHFSFFYHIPEATDRNPQGFYAEPPEYNWEK